MLKGILPLPMDIAKLLAPINWNELNKKAKGNYSQAASEAFKLLNLDQAQILRIKKLMDESCTILAEADLEIKRMGNVRKKGS